MANAVISACNVLDIQMSFHLEGGANEALFVRAINEGIILAVDDNGQTVPFTLEVIKG